MFVYLIAASRFEKRAVFAGKFGNGMGRLLRPVNKVPVRSI